MIHFVGWIPATYELATEYYFPMRFRSVLAPILRGIFCCPTMPSLRHIVADHGPILVLDAASSRVQAGIMSANDAPRWVSLEEEAGTGVFACLNTLAIDPALMGGFVFCEGPGSILGIRTVAAVLRAWLALGQRPVWAYKSLELVGAALGNPAVHVISDARRESWHLARPGQPCLRVPSPELPREAKYATPANFRQWSRLPEGLCPEIIPYELEQLVAKTLDADLYQLRPEPDAFLHEDPVYATWTPQIHRAPS